MGETGLGFGGCVQALADCSLGGLTTFEGLQGATTGCGGASLITDTSSAWIFPLFFYSGSSPSYSCASFEDICFS